MWQSCVSGLPLTCRCATVRGQQFRARKINRNVQQPTRVRRTLLAGGLSCGLTAYGLLKFGQGSAVVSKVSKELPPVNAERVYEFETKLKKSGFTDKQARALLIATACLRRLKEKVTFEDVEKVFDSAWAVEDDMIQAGFARAQARQLSLMFVALASSKKDGYVNRNSDSYWDFWEVSDVSHMSDCLERAGAEKYTGYTLADAMLHFARKEWDS